MERKRKVVILNGDKWDKQDFEEKIRNLKNEIADGKSFLEEEKNVLLSTILRIENEDIENCNAVRSEEGAENLVRDLLHDNIDIIISRDAKTFNRIGHDELLPILIASRCSVYSLDGKVNTILPIKKYEATLLYLTGESYMEKCSKKRRKKNENLPKCEICKKEMSIVKGCSVDTISIEGKTYERIKVGDVYDLAEGIEDEEFRCHDCNAQNGHYHHWGCDNERCPACKQQLINCECKEVYIDTFDNVLDALEYDSNKEKIKTLENKIKNMKEKIKEHEKEAENKVGVHIRKNSRTKKG